MPPMSILLLFPLAFAPQQNPDQLPNVVLLMTDDQGWGDVGFRDHPELLTPALDQMASSGICMERFYAAAPVCSPTRGSCLTGRHPYRYGIRYANDGHLPEDQPNLARILQKRGYRTGHFGKWHLGTMTTTEKDSNRGGRKFAAHYAPPWDRGFDVCFSTESKVPTYNPMVVPDPIAQGIADKTPGDPFGTYYWTGPGQKASDDPTVNLSGDDSTLIMDRALEFVDHSVATEAPFLAVIWFHAPHLPVIAGEEHRQDYADLSLKEQHYYGALAAVDQQIGRLRKRLEQLGVADDTLIWFTSDNGPEGKAGEGIGTAGPFRGRKRSLYEGGVRVPGMIVWPKKFRQARRIHAPCSTLDILPTVLSAIGEELPADLDGINLLPLLEGETEQRSAPFGFESKKQSAWMEEKYKLLRFEDKSGQAKFELYDLTKDPGEKENLADSESEKLASMSKGLETWRRSIAADARRMDPRPNIVFIMADDLGKEWISCYGSESLQTPNIDDLAENGLRFENVYSMPLCTPTRATLLTGQYPFNHGWINHWDVPRWGNGCHFDPKEYTTFANILRDAGYATAIAGKWQINDFRVQPKVLAQHGFVDWCVWTGYETSNPPSAERYWDPYLHTRSGSHTYQNEFGADVFTDFLIESLGRNRHRPNLLYFPMCLPHTPFVSTPLAPDARGANAKYEAMVAYVDYSVGRMMSALEEEGLSDNTIVIFTTDNGSAGNRTGRILGREVVGGKSRLSESGCNAPFIVHWPGHILPSQVTSELVDFSDILPTLADLADAKIPARLKLDGYSFANLIRGAKSTRDPSQRPWILSMGGGQAVYKDGRVIPKKAFADRVIRDVRYKLWIEDGAPTRLFDLQQDPAETINLIESAEQDHLSARNRLIDVYRSFPSQDAAPRYAPNPPQEWDRMNEDGSIKKQSAK